MGDMASPFLVPLKSAERRGSRKLHPCSGIWFSGDGEGGVRQFV